MHNYMWLWMVGCIGLAACSSTSGLVNIDGEDRHARFGEGEILLPLGNKSPTQHDRDYRVLSIGYARGTGQFDQVLSSSVYVDVDGTQLHGSATLNNEAILNVMYLRGLRHTFTSKSFEWYRGGGVALLDMDFTTTDGLQYASTNHSGVTLHGLLGIAYHFTPTFGAEGNIGIYTELFAHETSSSLWEERIQFFVTPAPSVRLHAGYRSWGYSAGYNNRSDIEFFFSGASVGAAFLF